MMMCSFFEGGSYDYSFVSRLLLGQKFTLAKPVKY